MVLLFWWLRLKHNPATADVPTIFRTLAAIRHRCHGQRRTSLLSHPNPPLYSLLTLSSSFTLYHRSHSLGCILHRSCPSQLEEKASRIAASPACETLPSDVTLSSIRSNLDPSDQHASSLPYTSEESAGRRLVFEIPRSSSRIIARSACTNLELGDSAVLLICHPRSSISTGEFNHPLQHTFPSTARIRQNILRTSYYPNAGTFCLQDPHFSPTQHYKE